VAYALSRKDEDVEAFICVISIIQPDSIIEARDEWKNDENIWTIIQRLQQDYSASYTFTWKMIHYGRKIAYINVRNPNPNKRCYWNCTPL
jgi:hypothetical protein